MTIWGNVLSAPVITIEEKPDPKLRDEILKPLRAFNESKLGPIKNEPVAITLCDPKNGTVIGGLWGASVVGWLYVDLLAVPEEFRGLGLGRQLLTKAEDVARKRGCRGMWLYTATFQAPGFYEKLGFERFGAIPDYIAGHDNIYYAKRWDR
jgi:ribosomal protein S18 acetylase RimI-like enzyme